MSTKRVFLVVVGVFASTSFAACVSNRNGGAPLPDDGGLSFDGASPGSEDGAMPGGDSGAQESSTTDDGAPNGSDAGGDGAAPPSGTLDPGFGGKGYVIGNAPLLTDGGTAKLYGYESLAADSQGRLLVTGAVEGAGQYGQVYAWRFLASGALDTSFGSSGQTTFPDPGDNDYPTGLCVDGSGNVLVAGYTLSDGPELWRFTSTGAVDTTFDGTGEVPSPGNGFGYAIACTAAGTLVGGYSSGPTVWRYTQAGALDTANFGAPNGYAQDDNAEFSPSSGAHAMAVDGTGRIVLAGVVNSDQNTSFGTGVWRFSSAGTSDSTFGSTEFGAGYVVPSLQFDAGGADAGGFTWSGAAGVTTDSSNNVVVVDLTGVARLTSTGALDATFAGGAGRLELPLPAAATAGSGVQLFGVTIDGEGRILVAGTIEPSLGTTLMAVWRLTSAGALDTTFGAGGSFASHETAGGTIGDYGTAILVDSSNRPYIGGMSALPSGDFVPVVWRLAP